MELRLLTKKRKIDTQLPATVSEVFKDNYFISPQKREKSKNLH